MRYRPKPAMMPGVAGARQSREWLKSCTKSMPMAGAAPLWSISVQRIFDGFRLLFGAKTVAIGHRGRSLVPVAKWKERQYE
jgi:hypothetical protein